MISYIGNASGKTISGGGDMKNESYDKSGPAWGIAAGLILAIVGSSMGLFPKLLHSTGTLNDFVACGVTMIGIFLVVYAIHELRRSRHR
ncbi:hypothetical protein [Burkholderia lata]|uniref:hypothetical protein n=1 Tax=Burkholderia lata (strain ATCC 17760 / DSM 23089 / LMG 22485 / NCIMB 9086 / R18194 / 383) TaxID=482957 RepID=UPI003F68B4D8